MCSLVGMMFLFGSRDSRLVIYEIFVERSGSVRGSLFLGAHSDRGTFEYCLRHANFMRGIARPWCSEYYKIIYLNFMYPMGTISEAAK